MTVYATRLINGTDSRERLRRADALGLFPTGVGTARGGFRNDGGGVVSVNAGTMTVAVTPFMAYVDGGVSDAQGGYTFVSDATETLSVSPGHASLSRTDVVIAEVRDTTHDGSGSTDARVRILEGSPGSGVPALPTNALALRNITVPAGLSAGTGGLASGNLSTDRRTYTTGLGGVLTVASQAERDALPSIVGTEVFRADLDRLQVRTSSGWVNVTHGADVWAAYTPTWGTGSTLGNGTMEAAYNRRGNTVHFRVQIVLGTTTTVGTGTQSLTLPVAPRAGTVPSFHGEAFDVSAGGSIPIHTTMVSGSTFALLVPDVSAGAYDRILTNVVPFGWAQGDRIYVSGTYECA